MPNLQNEARRTKTTFSRGGIGENFERADRIERELDASAIPWET